MIAGAECRRASNAGSAQQAARGFGAEEGWRSAGARLMQIRCRAGAGVMIARDLGAGGTSGAEQGARAQAGAGARLGRAELGAELGVRGGDDGSVQRSWAQCRGSGLIREREK
ncbi:hypothetical protein SLEP1_g60395 [Rubroshorea leprosula]|uniref:Uncharacterized protein n=1 Tax=Rubroshorea leprosula TaxID=152421 RepID=A0AAV5MZT6_9ROSI|nr:hypothetical protein SLEP1_g60395 [Rubroshorea leprosula]